MCKRFIDRYLNPKIPVKLAQCPMKMHHAPVPFGEVKMDVLGVRLELNCAPDLGQLMQPDSIDIVPG